MVGAGADGDDIDSILAELDAAQSAVCSEESAERPSPRARLIHGATAWAGPAGGRVRSFLLFGGEYYDGRKCQVFGDLFRLRTTRPWLRRLGPGSRAVAGRARSAHQAVLARGPGSVARRRCTCLVASTRALANALSTLLRHLAPNLPARIGGAGTVGAVCTDSKAAQGASRAVGTSRARRAPIAEFMVVFEASSTTDGR